MTANNGRDQFVLIYGGFALSLAVVIAVCQPWNLYDHFMIGAPFGRDFANFWLGGRLALKGRLDLLADFHGYNVLMAETFGHTARDHLVFSYPPSILPFLVPFGALPFLPALLLWTMANLAGLVVAARMLAPDRSAIVAACLSPAAVVMVAYGHFGGVLAVLATAALWTAERRPILAGLCLALIGVKPQIAAVIAVILVLTGRWRPVAWSVPFTGAIVGVTILLWGIEPWQNFFGWTMPFHVGAMVRYDAMALRTTVSVYAAARQLELPLLAGEVLQGIFSVMVVMGAVLAIIRHGMTPRTIALGLLSALAALAYFQHYDLAMTAPAAAVALFTPGAETDRPFLAPIPAALLWLAPPFAMSFGLLYVPAIPLVIAVAVSAALMGALRKPGADGRWRPSWLARRLPSAAFPAPKS